MPDGKTETMTAAEFNALSSSSNAGATSERAQQEALAKWAAASEGERPASPVGNVQFMQSVARGRAVSRQKG